MESLKIATDRTKQRRVASEVCEEERGREEVGGEEGIYTQRWELPEALRSARSEKSLHLRRKIP